MIENSFTFVNTYLIFFQKEAKYKLVSLFLQDLFDWFEKSQKHENEGEVLTFKKAINYS